MKEYVIFLIPGTVVSLSFRRKRDTPTLPKWTRDGSAFRSQVASLLGNNVRFEVIDWPRGNNLPDREVGAKNLSDCIKQISAERPQARLFVVGHSHGGTVGWLGFSSKDPIFKRISGLVCMGTPFVVCMEPRIKLDRSMKAVVVVVTLLASVSGAVVSLIREIVVSTVQGFSSSRWNFVTLNSQLVNGAVIGAISMAVALLPFVHRLRRWTEWKNKAEELISNSQARHDLYERMKIIRSPGDETGALSVVHVLSWLSCRVSEKLGQRYLQSEVKRISPSGAIPKELLLFLVLYCVCSFLVPFAGVSPRKAAVICISGMAVVIIWHLGLFQLFAVISWEIVTRSLLAASFALRCLAAVMMLGRRLMPCCLFAEIVAEPTPSGDWSITQLEPTWTSPDGEGAFAHSTYDHPATPQTIAEWILSRPAY